MKSDYPNNDDRANWAAAALSAFPGASGDEADLRDLISNLLHLAVRGGKDWEDELRVAVDNFKAEMEEVEDEKPVRHCDRCGVGIYEDWTTAESPESAGGNCTNCGEDLCPVCWGMAGPDEDGTCQRCQDGNHD